MSKGVVRSTSGFAIRGVSDIVPRRYIQLQHVSRWSHYYYQKRKKQKSAKYVRGGQQGKKNSARVVPVVRNCLRLLVERSQEGRDGIRDNAPFSQAALFLMNADSGVTLVSPPVHLTGNKLPRCRKLPQYGLAQSFLTKQTFDLVSFGIVTERYERW